MEKQDFILAKQKEQLAAQQSKLDELTLKVSDMETLLENVSAAAYDKAGEVVTDVVPVSYTHLASLSRRQNSLISFPCSVRQSRSRPRYLVK